MKKTLTLAFLAFLLHFQTLAQPVQIFLGEAGRDIIQQLTPSPDGNFYAVGSRTVGSAPSKIWLLKIGTDAQIIWEKTYTLNNNDFEEHGFGLSILPDGNLIITGVQRSDDVFDPEMALALKTDAQGNQVWKRTYANVTAVFDATPVGNNIMLVGWSDYTGSTDGGQILLVNSNGILQWKLPIEVVNQTKVRRIFPTSDGKLLLVGRSNAIGVGFEGIFLRKIELDGSEIWQKTEDLSWEEPYSFSSSDFYNRPLGAAQQPDGSIWITHPTEYYADIALLHFSATGDLLAKKIYGSPNTQELPYSLQILTDGKILLSGEASGSDFPINYQGFAMLTDPNGLELWRHYYGTNSSSERLFGSATLSNGDLLFVGGSNQQAGGGAELSDGWLLRTESDGNALPWAIQGKIVIDLNNNCQEDPGEPPARHWFVNVSDSVVHTLNTDDNGLFELRTSDGNVIVSAFSPAAQAGIWTFCQNDFPVLNDAAHPLANVTFFVQSTDGGCPHTEVSVTQPDLHRCDTSRFFVTVQNHGAGPSNGLLLEVKLDPELGLVSASESYAQNGQTFAFSVDPMSGFASKTIEIRAKLSCDVQMSATHAIVANISPIECATDWDGPIFRIDGRCEGSDVKFEMQNIGGGGASASTFYRIMADDLLFGSSTAIDLPSNAPAEVLLLPADGHTWRVELLQAPGYPALSLPSATVEGCGTGANGLHSIAFRNAWRFDDSAPEVSAVLAPNTSGLADKIAEATHGFGLYNFIDDKDWLEFTARFENPLPIQANGVEFRFTFSPTLDVRTFQPLAWNAPVSFELDNNGAIHVKMPDAILDTSGLDAVAMLRFRIHPLPEVPPDSGSYSLFVVSGNAYAEGTGPYPLTDGFLNYSQTFLSSSDVYNSYGPDVLRFGGRSYDFGTTLAQAADGSVFLVGESSSYSDRTFNDGLLIKANTKGKAYWLTAIDLGDGASNTISGVTPLNDGGCMVVGNYLPKTATDGSLSEYTPYIARINATGKLLWHKKFRPYGEQYGAWASGILSTSDGNVLIFGFSESEFGSDHYYRKMTVDGDLIWATTEAINGSAFRPSKALSTPDGGFVFAGTNESTVLNFGIYLEKIDANGSKIWSKGHNPEEGIYFGSAAPAPDGGYMVMGYTQWEADTNDYVTTPLFVKFTPEGIFEWEKMPIIGPWGSARTYNIVPDPTGGYFVAGEIFVDTLDHFNDILLLKIDDNADTLWWRNYGARNTEWAESLLLTSTNEVMLWGFNQSRPPLYDLQCVLVQTDLEGNVPTITPDPMPPTDKVVVMPNPAKDFTKVILMNRSTSLIHWQLRQISGQWIQQGISSGPTFDISLEGLPSGIYILSFPGEGLAAKKVVVIR
ncbi:MAG: hypothetical protein ACKVU0_07190 [Saprospiraceae bacterium]